ncbi:hypothetical protein [Allosphingosinicella deserti]|nr:hypothetical protein [Sphingomonas deserti]
MAWTSDEDEAVRHILLAWETLSPGDLSTLSFILKHPGGRLATAEGSANCTMWENFERLGWARSVDIGLPPPARFFEVTEDGYGYIPRFIERFHLGPVFDRPTQPSAG